MHDRTWRSPAALLVVLVALGMSVSGCQASKGTTTTPNAVPSGTGSANTGSGALSGILSSSNPFASPATSLGTHNPLSGPPADPFAGTPAEGWANGAAGIVAPEARPAGRFSASKVAKAYAMTRQLLIAQNLDRATLLGGPPAAFESLLTVQQRSVFVAGLDKAGLDKSGFPVSTRTMVVSFAPGSTALVGDVIKVHGTMSAQPVTERGARMLEVKINYIFVYAIEPPHHPDQWMRVVAQEAGQVLFGNWAQAKTTFEPWVQSAPSRAGVLCGMKNGYLHPAYPDGPQSPVKPSGKPVDPYSTSSPSSSASAGCQQTTGT